MAEAHDFYFSRKSISHPFLGLFRGPHGLQDFKDSFVGTTV
jgi:hypothetical protein